MQDWFNSKKPFRNVNQGVSTPISCMGAGNISSSISNSPPPKLAKTSKKKKKKICPDKPRVVSQSVITRAARLR
jgi:hypothetical protein